MQTHTYTQPLWRHVFVVCFACGGAEAFEVLVIPSVSICVVSKILEQKFWPFKGDMSDASWSTRGQMIFPNLGSWQWTTIANLLARILCQCQSPFHRVQNVLLPGTCFVRPRDFLAVKFAPASCKAAGVWGFPNWLAYCYDVSLGKGAGWERCRRFFPQCMLAPRTRFGILNKVPEFQLLGGRRFSEAFFPRKAGWGNGGQPTESQSLTDITR